MCPDKDVLYWQLTDELRDFYRKHHWWLRHFLAGSLKRQVERERLRQSRRAEEQIADFIRDEFGYQVNLTTPNCPFDLWVADGNRAARVEVKLSTYHLHPPSRSGRYQVDIRQHADVDVIIWICRSEEDWLYVIPAGDLRGRRNLAIWSRNPGQYRGQWLSYLNAWNHLRQAITNTHWRVWQPSLTFPAQPNWGGSHA